MNKRNGLSEKNKEGTHRAREEKRGEPESGGERSDDGKVGPG